MHENKTDDTYAIKTVSPFLVDDLIYNEDQE